MHEAEEEIKNLKRIHKSKLKNEVGKLKQKAGTKQPPAFYILACMKHSAGRREMSLRLPARTERGSSG